MQKNIRDFDEHNEERWEYLRDMIETHSLSLTALIVSIIALIKNIMQ